MSCLVTTLKLLLRFPRAKRCLSLSSLQWTAHRQTKPWKADVILCLVQFLGSILFHLGVRRQSWAHLQLYMCLFGGVESHS